MSFSFAGTTVPLTRNLSGYKQEKEEVWKEHIMKLPSSSLVWYKALLLLGFELGKPLHCNPAVTIPLTAPVAPSSSTVTPLLNPSSPMASPSPISIAGPSNNPELSEPAWGAQARGPNRSPVLTSVKELINNVYDVTGQAPPSIKPSVPLSVSLQLGGFPLGGSEHHSKDLSIPLEQSSPMTSLFGSPKPGTFDTSTLIQWSPTPVPNLLAPLSNLDHIASIEETENLDITDFIEDDEQPKKRKRTIKDQAQNKRLNKGKDKLVEEDNEQALKADAPHHDILQPGASDTGLNLVDIPKQEGVKKSSHPL